MSEALLRLTPETVVSATGACMSAEVDGELVMFDAERCLYHGLDALGAEILGMMRAPTRIDRVVATLTARYDGPPDTIAADTRDLLAAMLDSGLIEIYAADAAA